ncbi:hypothetical protein [Providencia sp. PROV174]|uniref:hypothetical protein n=1 Tax=Providencia sp. PROV174 TaxID=2949877 RepID=UPI00234AB086|nr:hypothetical protein [Providencia sp. PROV174]
MLYIVTFNEYFGQHLSVESSLNVTEIKKILYKMGVESRVIDIEDLVRDGVNIKCNYFITSHQNQSIKKYLNDIVFSLFSNKNKNLITPLELYFAHENKGIQAILYNNGKDINLVNQSYLIDYKDIDKASVFKMTDGAGSRGVHLVKNQNDIRKIIKKEKIHRISLESMIKNTKKIIKKLIPNKYNHKFENYQSYKIPFVLQDFVANLQFDYKVLVFWDHLYVLKRNVRENDFRASGSGLFSFIEPNLELLQTCVKIRKTLNTPFISLDIIMHDEKKFSCIEYQATHFGPYTQIKSEFFYTIDEFNNIIKEKNIYTLEHEYAYSLFNFLKTEKDV